MKTLTLSAVALLLHAVLTPPASAGADWLTDLTKAQVQARAENKPLLVNFTGSDWCGWCIRLKKEVFNTAEFAAYAEKNLVLVEIDFPRHKAQSAATRSANEALSARYRVEGFPTIVVASAQGAELGRLGYDPGGPKPFLRQVAQLTGKPSAPAPVAALKKAEGTFQKVAAQREEGMPSEEKPLFNGAPPAAPQNFTDLVLKGISGPKNRRLAVINNQTFGAGETALLKLGNKQVKVRCVEVRETSVVVAVDGESAPREVKLRQGL